MRRTHLTAVLAGLLLVTGCNGGDDNEAKDPGKGEPSADPCAAVRFDPSVTIKPGTTDTAIVYLGAVSVSPGGAHKGAEMSSLVDTVVLDADKTAPAEDVVFAVIEAAGGMLPADLPQQLPNDIKVRNRRTSNQAFSVYRVGQIASGSWSTQRCVSEGANAGDLVDLNGRFRVITDLGPAAVEGCLESHADSIEQQAARLACR